MIPLLGPGSMLCRIKKFVMHFQVKSLSGKSFTWSESMGPANLYSGLQKLPQSLWVPFLWSQKGLDHLEPLAWGWQRICKKKGSFSIIEDANPKYTVCFLIFHRSLPSYEPTFDFAKTSWLYITRSECDQFLSNPFLVSVG